MGRNLIFGDREVAFLQELLRQKVDFMVVGLSAAALQGAPVVTQDVDLWFRDLGDPGLARALRRVRGSYVPRMALHPPMFAGPGLALFDIVVHMHGLEAFDAERERAIRVPLGRFKVPVLPLERILASKQALGRPKDRLVLRVLADACAAVEEHARQRRRRTRPPA